MSQPCGNWTLSRWLDHLENRYPQTIKLGLTRIKQLAQTLGLLSPKARVITVAGTNGKGTSVAALESIYLTAGYRVGTYTSPHLLSFNERIKINGVAITDDALCQLFCDLVKAREAMELSYFETATLAALLHFKNENLDLIILEVGLGGRLDATNILNPNLSIITSIDYDHQEFLGPTLEHIGFEKAGILRSNQPFIYAGKLPPETVTITASLLNCATYIQGKDYTLTGETSGTDLTFRCGPKTITIPNVPWHPNAIASVIMASVCLQEQLPLQDCVLIEGLQSITLDGRQQYCYRKGQALTLFDVAHNAESVRYLAECLRRRHPKQKIHAVFSALGDKDIAALISPMKDLVDCWYPALLTGKRAASIAQLQLIFKKYDIMPKQFYESSLEAYQLACQQASLNDLIVVYGSFLTVGEVLAALDKGFFSRSGNESCHRGKIEA